MPDIEDLFFTVEDKGAFNDNEGNPLVLTACWQTGGFSICIEDWSNDRLRIVAYLAGIQIARKTVTANDPCLRINENPGGIRVRAEICADFKRRCVIAEGEVRLLIPLRFRQIIFAW